MSDGHTEIFDGGKSILELLGNSRNNLLKRHHPGDCRSDVAEQAGEGRACFGGSPGNVGYLRLRKPKLFTKRLNFFLRQASLPGDIAQSLFLSFCCLSLQKLRLEFGKLRGGCPGDALKLFEVYAELGKVLAYVFRGLRERAETGNKAIYSSLRLVAG